MLLVDLFGHSESGHWVATIQVILLVGVKVMASRVNDPAPSMHFLKSTVALAFTGL